MLVHQVRSFAPGRFRNQEQTLLDQSGTYDSAISLSTPNVADNPQSLPYASRRRLFPQSKNSLGVDALGEPAEVLVLQDRQAQDRRNAQISYDAVSRANAFSSAEALSSQELLEEIEGERGTVDQDEAHSNIENVKNVWANQSRKYSDGISTADYALLVSQLTKGFTMKQLAAYLERTSTQSRTDSMDLQHEYTGRLYARSRWTLGINPTDQPRIPNMIKPRSHGASQDRVQVRRSEKFRLHKPTLVDMILRHRWQVKVKQDEELLGVLDVQLHPIHLDLLTNHKRGILKQLSESYGAKIDVSSQKNIIRVTSDEATCQDILKVLVLALDNICSVEHHVPLQLKRSLPSSEKSSQPSLEVLLQVQQLTNTIIENESTDTVTGKIRIHYVGPGDEDLQDAQRLLYRILMPKKASDRRLVWASPLGLRETVPVPTDVGSGLPLVDRDQQWSRWSAPIARQLDSEYERDDQSERLISVADPSGIQSEVFQALNRYRVTRRDKHVTVASPCWIPEKRYWDTVTLGRFLFPSKVGERCTPVKLNAKGDAGEILIDNLNDCRREFITNVPGMIRSLEHLGLESLALGMESEEYMVINLAPSLPKTSQLSSDALPDLEIQIAFDNESQASSIKHVRTTLEKQMDFLLPHKSMDLRFARKSCVYANPDNLDPSILQFIENSNLDIWGTEQLRTPTKLSLRIPPHVLRLSTSTATQKLTELIPVEYTFTSLEHRSTLSIPFRQAGSWSKFIYTDTEAGKIGGRSASLSLTHLSTTQQEHESTPSNPKTNTASYPRNNTTDETAPSSLFRKANALINMIEKRPDTADDAFSEKFAMKTKDQRQRVSDATRRLHLNLPTEPPKLSIKRIPQKKRW